MISTLLNTISIYNRASYSETPAYPQNKPVEELLREAGVVLRGKGFFPASKPLKENIMMLAASWFGSTDVCQPFFLAQKKSDNDPTMSENLMICRKIVFVMERSNIRPKIIIG